MIAFLVGLVLVASGGAAVFGVLYGLAHLTRWLFLSGEDLLICGYIGFGSLVVTAALVLVCYSIGTEVLR